MTDLVWEEPPAKRNGPKVSERHEAMRLNPGRWLVWHESVTEKSASQLAYWLGRKHPECETLSRGRKVYARFVPERAP